MQTKQINVNVNWLDEIDGKTVADAIAYLQTLNPSHTLSYSMEGDTHGCSVESSLYYDVPMSNAEILEGMEKAINKQIGYYEKSKQEHLKNGRTQWADSVERNLINLRTRLEQARIKYGNNN